ncbi:hypothetical protein Agabi119p4_8867 [Agaricus bisporus var. burnettii]|uniref:Uncharacterized protein n=1 Tax=Agaricus bisporus var. burnettii TaxID=192524 RepID=A0A8H7C677_AGABI|nr:hypothetical protein Agabi119p4_8867 [Agaricus bisporus var. burnettii]
MNTYFKSLIAAALVFATFTPVTASPVARHVGRQEGSIPVGPQPTTLGSLNGTQEMPSSAVFQPTASYSTEMPSSATAEPTSISSVSGNQSVPSASSSMSETMTFFPPCYIPTPSTDTLTNGSPTTFEGGSSAPTGNPGVSTSSFESVTLLPTTTMPSPTEIPDASSGIPESATLPTTVMSPPTEVPGGNTGSSESATLSIPSSPTAVSGVSASSPGSMTVDTTATATETPTPATGGSTTSGNA